MSRPDFITNEDINRWSENIDNDPFFPKEWAQSPLIREVSYAGLWLLEELEKLDCPLDKIERIRWTAGQYSFGRDAWKAHQEILQQYKDNQLTYQPELEKLN